jgi:hypothetical protein
MTELETIVRAKLASAVETAPEPVAVAAVERKVRARRRWMTGLAAAVGVAVVAVPSFVVAVHDGTTGTNPTTNGSTIDRHDGALDGGIPPRGQVGTLPAGEPPSVPWTFGRMLRQGDDEVAVPGTSGPDLIGVVDGGWFLLVEFERPPRYVFHSHYVVLHPDGSVTRLPSLQLPHRPFVQEATVSPDGTQVVGQSIVDVETGEIVATLPRGADHMVGWGPSGIVYDDPSAGGEASVSWLWRPGSAPIRLDREVRSVVGGSARVIAGLPGACGEVSDLAGDGALTPVWRGCGGLYPSLLSPDGQRVLTADFSVVDIDSGTVSARRIPDLSRTGFDRVDDWLMTWEDPTHLVFPVDSRWLVRCDVTTFACERAAGPLRITPNRDINFVGAN